MFATLAALVGSSFVSAEPERLQRASGSWFPPHLKTRPLLTAVVVSPANSLEVAAVVAWAQANGKTYRAVGGGSGTRELPAVDIALDLARLTQLDWSEEDLTVTVGAGITIAALEEQLTRHGYTLGQHLGSANLATVGGCIATDAVGLFSGRYGRFRDTVLAKTEHGGIITDATLTIRPQPEARAWAVFTFEQLTDALTAVRLIHRCDARPALARITSPPTPSPRRSFLTGKGGMQIVLAFEGDELVQTGHFQLAYAVCQQLGGVPGDPDEGEAWLERRQHSELWSANAHPDTFADLVRVPVRWSGLVEAYHQLVGALEGRVPHLSVEVAHPTSHGATIELAFTVNGTEQRYRELRASILNHATD